MMLDLPCVCFLFMTPVSRGRFDEWAAKTPAVTRFILYSSVVPSLFTLLFLGQIKARVLANCPAVTVFHLQRT